MTQSATGIAVGCAIGIPVGIVALIAGVMWIKMQKRFAKEREMDNDDIDKFNEEDLDLQNIYDNDNNNIVKDNTKSQSVDPFVCDSSPDLEMDNGESNNNCGSRGNAADINKSNTGSKENFDHDSTATATNSTVTNTTTTTNTNTNTNTTNNNNNNNNKNNSSCNNKGSRYVPAYKRNLKKSLSIFKESSNSGNNNNNPRSVQYVNGNATEGSLSTESNIDSGDSTEQNSTSSRVTPVSNALPQQLQQQQQQQHEFHRIEQDIYDTYVPFDDSPLKGSRNTFESPGNVFATPQSKGTSNSNSSSIGNMKGLERTFNSITNLASKVNNKPDTGANTNEHSDGTQGSEPRLHNSLSNEHLLMKNLSTKNYDGSYPRMNTERDKTKFTQTQSSNNQQQLKKEIADIARTPSRKRSMYITDDPNDISSVFDDSD